MMRTDQGYPGGRSTTALKVAILVPPRVAGERLDQEDTFIQAAEVSDCLRALGHIPVSATYVDHGEGTIAPLRAIAPDVVVNLVEEVPEGSDQLHRATALLDRLGVRYTGARTDAIEALGNKLAMKARLRSAGLPTAPTLDDAPAESTFIVKSATEHASLGLDDCSVVQGADAARRLIAKKTAAFGGDWFAEAYVEGREFDLPMIEIDGGAVILGIAEVTLGPPTGKPRIYGFANKWDEQSSAFDAALRIFPAREEPLFSQLERIAFAAWDEFGLSGFSHIEFRVDGAGRPFILEVNANPCLTREAGYILSAEQAGMSQTDVVAALLAAA